MKLEDFRGTWGARFPGVLQNGKAGLKLSAVQFVLSAQHLDFNIQNWTNSHAVVQLAWDTWFWVHCRPTEIRSGRLVGPRRSPWTLVADEAETYNDLFAAIPSEVRTALRLREVPQGFETQELRAKYDRGDLAVYLDPVFRRECTVQLGPMEVVCPKEDVEEYLVQMLDDERRVNERVQNISEVLRKGNLTIEELRALVQAGLSKKLEAALLGRDLTPEMRDAALRVVQNFLGDLKPPSARSSRAATTLDIDREIKDPEE